jgi:hypothetical protein
MTTVAGSGTEDTTVVGEKGEEEETETRLGGL